MLANRGNGSDGTERNDVEFRGKTYSTVRFGTDGPLLIEFPRFVDERGTFIESYSFGLFQKLGLPEYWAQDNVSFSRRGVIRGMHIQRVNCQGKLIQCLSGAIQDVALDLRPGSPTIGKTFSVVLRAEYEKAQLFYVPEGFAHGFLALEESLVAYKCTTEHVAVADGGIHPLSCGVKWMVERDLVEKRHISSKDNALPSLVDYLRPRE